MRKEHSHFGIARSKGKAYFCARKHTENEKDIIYYHSLALVHKYGRAGNGCHDRCFAASRKEGEADDFPVAFARWRLWRGCDDAQLLQPKLQPLQETRELQRRQESWTLRLASRLPEHRV